MSARSKPIQKWKYQKQVVPKGIVKNPLKSHYVYDKEKLKKFYKTSLESRPVRKERVMESPDKKSFREIGFDVQAKHLKEMASRGARIPSIVKHINGVHMFPMSHGPHGHAHSVVTWTHADTPYLFDANDSSDMFKRHSDYHYSTFGLFPNFQRPLMSRDVPIHDDWGGDKKTEKLVDDLDGVCNELALGIVRILENYAWEDAVGFLQHCSGKELFSVASGKEPMTEFAVVATSKIVKKKK